MTDTWHWHTGDIIQLVSIVVGIIVFVVSSHMTRNITKREVYQRLELASIDLFRFEMGKNKTAWRLYDSSFSVSTVGKDSQEGQEVLNHVTQLLNLFEMCVELRNDKIVDNKIFSTWLKWIFEIASLDNFQYLWKENLHNHYTDHLGELIRTKLLQNHV